MLEKLGEALQNALRSLAGKSVVDRAAVEEFVRDMQRALISSDVEVKLVFELSEKIRKRALEEKQLEGFSTRDHVLKVIYEELVGIAGEKSHLDTSRRPLHVMMVGLFGSGKTTTCGKLAKYLKKRGFRVAFIGADNYRPAAQEQIKQLAAQTGVDAYAEPDPLSSAIVKAGMEKFKKHDVIIVDTAGRNALDGQMLAELAEIKSILHPHEIFLVVGADLGQQAGRQAREFSKVGITGVIVTKIEGTAKGGGALTSCAASGAPIKFLGTGEKLDDLDEFEPNGFISRLLGWGDIQALIKKAEEAAREHTFDPHELIDDFTLESFYKQLELTKSLGPMKNVMQMLGINSVPDELLGQGEEKMKKYKHILDSMSRQEKKQPDIITASRMTRIAKGAGVDESEVRELLRHFKEARKMIKIVKKGRVPADLARRFNIKGLGGKLK